MHSLWKCVCATAAFAIVFAWGLSATAQESAYPAKPVRIVIPLGPGNSVEIVTRLVAEKLTQALGQPFLIEPQPGASGQIGTERVARATPDGYTLLAANDGIMTMLPNLQKNVRYAPMRDFAPITLAAIGLMRLARRAGIRPASAAATPSSSIVEVATNGSHGCT